MLIENIQNFCKEGQGIHPATSSFSELINWKLVNSSVDQCSKLYN
jgi:hypothetical protein